MSAVFQYLTGAKISTRKTISGIPLEHWNYVTNFQKFAKEPSLPKPKEGESFTINWILPPFGQGSGGHLNIFRYIKLLEDLGHFNRIYIFGDAKFKSDIKAKRSIERNFFNLNAEVFTSIDDIADSDALIATSWQTAYVVNAQGNTHKKFYFIQDYEPYFYPAGSEYLFAQQTYSLDLHRITMGPWLSHYLLKEHDVNSDFINFGYDPSIYGTKQIDHSRTPNHHIFFYSRPATQRRCFELGIEALRELNRRGIEFKVYTIGQEVLHYKIPFKYENMGIMKQSELAKLYYNTDLGLVFSPTNTSLLPYEMMACGCPVIELDSPSNKINFSKSNAIKLAASNPVDIADKMEELLTNEEARKEQLKRAHEFVKPLTWEMSAKELESIFRTVLTG